MRCLLIEPDESNLADIEACLSMLQTEVSHAKTLDRALEIAKSDSVNFVLARFEVSDGKRLAKEVSDEFFKYEGLCDLPIIVIDKPERFEGLDDKELKDFKGSLELPVEFPSFPRKLSQLLGLKNEYSGDEEAGEAEGKGQREEDTTPAEEKKEEKPSSDVADGDQRERRLIVANAVMVRVLKRLEDDAAFTTSSAADIPQVIEKVTQEVCRSLDLEALFR